MQSELASVGTLLRMPGDDGLDRDIAWWQHCCEIAACLDDYVPVKFGDAPLQLRPYLTNLQGLIDAIKSEPFALVFGGWRAYVTETEAQNARRLGVLADAVARLREMRERAVNPDMIETKLLELGQFVVGRYRVIQPLDAVVRLWATRATRRMDLLPGEWRYL